MNVDQLDAVIAAAEKVVPHWTPQQVMNFELLDLQLYMSMVPPKGSGFQAQMCRLCHPVIPLPPGQMSPEIEEFILFHDQAFQQGPMASMPSASASFRDGLPTSQVSGARGSRVPRPMLSIACSAPAAF